MTTCREILMHLEKKAPRDLAEDFDNVGLVFGRGEREVKTALLCLNVNAYTINEAVREEADLIISHHPLMFEGEKTITDETRLGRLCLTLAENKISVIAMHTNLDSAEGGLNDLTAKRLGLTVEKSLGCVRLCKTPPMSMEALATRVKEKYHLPAIKFTGDLQKTLSRVAICTGSGKSFIEEVKQEGADAYITGDVTYSLALGMQEAGLSLIDLGHYESEVICKDYFLDSLQNFHDVRFILSKEPNVFSYL